MENTVSTPGELFAILSMVLVTRWLGYDLSLVASPNFQVYEGNTENMSSREMEQFLSENYINDGLGDFTDSSTRKLRAGSSVHLSSVPHSLSVLFKDLFI